LIRDGVVREAQCTPPDNIDCVLEGPGNTKLDFSSVAIDPSDDTTAWMGTSLSMGHRAHETMKRENPCRLSSSIVWDCPGGYNRRLEIQKDLAFMSG